MKKQYYRNWEADILLKDNRGFALVIVLLIFSVLVGIVTEFVYVVHNETVSLYNWRESQRLSLEAQSGIKVGESFLREILERFPHKYPGRVDLPVPDVGGDGIDAMLITVIDENGKLNINKIVNDNGKEDDFLFPSLKRLLRHLDIDITVADRIFDWIDENSEERVRDSEIDAKNGYLYSIDELLSIDGITDEIYQKLLPHVTIFGENAQGDFAININSADKYVLMSLSDDMNEELAKRILTYRELKPFENIGYLIRVAGMASIVSDPKFKSGYITFRGFAFTVKVNVMMDKLTRTVTTVISFATGRPEYKYWKET